MIDTDLSENIPSFEPDFSQSSPFVIPSPSSIDFDDHSDLGYQMPNDLDESAPEYQLNIPPDAQDPGYNAGSGDMETPPTYTPPSDPAPIDIPPYNPPDDFDDPPDHDYIFPDVPMPDYHYPEMD